MNVLVSFFEYLCYGSTAIMNIFSLTVRASTLVAESDVYRRHILTTKVGSRAVTIHILFICFHYLLLYSELN